jgi:hypothetical protein
MPATTLITTQQFSRLIGLPNSAAVVDVRIDDDYRADSRIIPGRPSATRRGDGLLRRDVSVVPRRN